MACLMTAGCKPSAQNHSTSVQMDNISEALIKRTPDTKIGYQLSWYRGQWFNVPQGYVTTGGSDKVLNMAKEDVLRRLLRSTARTGFDVETGQYDSSLRTEFDPKYDMSFCRRLPGEEGLNDLPPACNFLGDSDRIRRGAVRVTIDWPFLPNFENSFEYRPYGLAQGRVKEGRLAFLKDINFSEVEKQGPNWSGLKFYDQQEGYFASVYCNSARRSYPNFGTCTARVWNKSKNLAFQLFYGSGKEPENLANEWKELAVKADALISEFSVE